ncbi:MAG: alanine--tRNA ligase [Anaerolineaceae bacterium]
MEKKLTGVEIRKSFIDFFVERGHTFVQSSSLVPGGDQTLLFTNAGMVQFKDVFLGTDHRPYTRAVNSQKCMRVAGKHNDLDDVGRDDTHHTMFEMLGNWSFGDYYKKEAIAWAWELITEVWKVDKSLLWTTCFKDDKGNIPSDEEAFNIWKQQPGINPEQVMYFGRKENFWEMAETGPCGPCSEIHIDLGEKYCDKKGQPGHVCSVNGDCKRFLELWNLVFIQYNRINAEKLEPLPACHVDTGMGLERIVSVMQKVDSNYKTDLLFSLMEEVRRQTGESEEAQQKNVTPYRVIADHARAAAFLIADGVVPGNIGRNYVCRMIIRRAARFGGKLGLTEPFLARVAEKVVENYGQAYPELVKNKETILTNLTREEERFQKTVESGTGRLEELFEELKAAGKTELDGKQAFALYATNGLPLELTRDIAREQGYSVDEAGFKAAMEEHRLASGAGKAFGSQGGENVDLYRGILKDLQSARELGENGVTYDPYSTEEVDVKVLAVLRDGEPVTSAVVGEEVEIILPNTCFYIESGGQVSDSGTISSLEKGGFTIEVEEVRKPAAGIIIHLGKVTEGVVRCGELAVARVDHEKRMDIKRNHTATHLMHAKLHEVLGGHATQAGSLVAPDHLRFDFNHPAAMTAEEIEKVETLVNREILNNYKLNITVKPLAEAMQEGAMALFGEKYGESVRTISIGDEQRISYELCGGTHVDETADIGTFIITSEGSAAAGIRRIEAVTGRKAYELIQKRFRLLKQAASSLETALDETPEKIDHLLQEADTLRKEINRYKQEQAGSEFTRLLDQVKIVKGIPVLAAVLSSADGDTLRAMTDRFREKYPSGVVVLGSVSKEQPILVAVVTDDLVKKGLHAGEIVKQAAVKIGGSGGGRPNLAQAGGKDASKLSEALDTVVPYVKAKMG